MNEMHLANGVWSSQVLAVMKSAGKSDFQEGDTELNYYDSPIS